MGIQERQSSETADFIDVPQSLVRRVIGRAGETISMLQDVSGAKLDVSKGDTPPGVHARGSIKAIERARDMISTMIAEQESASPSGPQRLDTDTVSPLSRGAPP